MDGQNFNNQENANSQQNIDSQQNFNNQQNINPQQNFNPQQNTPPVVNPATANNYQNNASPFPNNSFNRPPMSPENDMPPLAIAALAVSIIGILTSCCGCIGSVFGIVGTCFGTILGIAGLILSLTANKEKKTNIGLAAMICSIVAIALCVISSIGSFIYMLVTM